MARILARKLADGVTASDLALIELMEEARALGMELIHEPEVRKELFYGIAEDPKLHSLLSKGERDAARSLVMERLKSANQHLES